MGDWTVALILLGLSALIVMAVGLVCRLMGTSRLVSFFSGGEDEKTVLTKTPGHNDYMSANKLSEAEAVAGAPAAESPVAEAGRESPVSPDSMSIVSEPEVGGGLQRAMSFDSMASESSIDDLEHDMPKIGQLEFGLEYDREVSELIISVIQARDLDPNPVTGTLDSYVKIWVLPHAMGRFQTRIQKESTNPVYAERFLCNIEPDDLDAKSLQFQVFSSDQFARHKLQGETDVRLGDLDLRQPLRIWMNLRDLDEKPTELGDLFFSLSYLPTAERLTVVIVKARNLKWSFGRPADCFVKVYLLQNGKKVAKKKTSVKREERSPIFNEAVIFNLPSHALSNVKLRITMAEQQNEAKLTSIGHVVLGSDVSGTELAHWNQMMTSLRRPVAMWHRLRR